MSLDKIGRYEIEGERGHGGMSSVYIARDPFMNRQVAIKVLSYKLVADTLFHKHFQPEAEVIASLERPVDGRSDVYGLGVVLFRALTNPSP